MDTKPLIVLLALVFPVMGCRPTAVPAGSKFYLQLVQGSDTDIPPTADSKPVGPKLRKKLGCVLCWKHYWEMHRAALVVAPGQTAYEPLGHGQSVELQMLDPEKVNVRIYSKSQLIRARQQPATNAFCISGARSEDDQSWFIVVRCDEPQPPESP